jgi:hypothetical protein
VPRTGGEMLTTAENEMFTCVGPGTLCGELMRRYWHPVAATVQLADEPGNSSSSCTRRPTA